MNSDLLRAAELEWANYAATVQVALVTAELDVVLRDDVIMTSSALFPTPDTVHACLLRTEDALADALIGETLDYFRGRSLPPTVYLSPACSPPDLAQRLTGHGLRLQETREAWMVLDNLITVRPPPLSNRVEVRQADRSESLDIAQTFVGAFELADEVAPAMAQLLAPSIGLPNVRHYLAWIEGQAVGTCSLLCQGAFGVLGSAGVLPVHRGRRVATSLVARAVIDAQARGVETLMLQTAADTVLERLLRISGFARAFTRSCYTLP